MSPHIPYITDFRCHRRTDLSLHGEVPRVCERNTVGAWRIEEVIDVQTVWQWVASVRSYRRSRRCRWACEQIEHWQVRIALAVLLGQGDRRIIVGGLAEYGAKASRSKTPPVPCAYDRAFLQLVCDSQPRSESKVVGFYSHVRGH